MNYPKIILHKGKEESLKRRHHWVFSGAIKKIISPQGKEIKLQEGEIVEVVSSENRYLATGHFQEGSIAVRILSFERAEIDREFWRKKILTAINFRKQLGFTENPETNVYRLVNAEGDGLPGLIVDFYNGTAVMQTHSIGFYKTRNEIAEILQELLGDVLLAVFDKSAETVPSREGLTIKNEYLFKKNTPGNTVVENSCKFYIDWETGQKTGFFIDQRENRKLLASYVKGKKVLNAFCYSGGFSVVALKAGALEVHSLDSSKKAIELTNNNVTLNSFSGENHQSLTEDALDFLKNIQGQYDVIVLDPPAFAKHLSARHKAVQGYKRLNALALKQIKPGGVIFTFSCSQVVDRNLFYNTIVAAAIESGRNIRVMHHLSQPTDHPVNIFHPEGEYLKGLVVWVE